MADSTSALADNPAITMGIFHFLNVLNGDCSVIQHPSDHVTVVDVNNAGTAPTVELLEKALAAGNFGQKNNPVDPIAYLRSHGIRSVFRFVLTHPDMDHMGGMKAFFDAFSPLNFWDTDNTEEKEFNDPCPYDEDDWLFYKKLRDGKPSEAPKRLELYADAKGKYFNRNENGESGGDGLYVLAPTKGLCADAKQSGECNDYSHVLLYRSKGGRIVVSGDSHDKTWEHILKNHKEDVAGAEVLLAPHHGRDSDRSFEFLDVVKPKLALFGNAESEHLAYPEFKKRSIPVITNNQAGCVVIDTNEGAMKVYVTNAAFAQAVSGAKTYSQTHRAYYCLTI